MLPIKIKTIYKKKSCILVCNLTYFVEDISFLAHFAVALSEKGTQLIFAQVNVRKDCVGLKFG